MFSGHTEANNPEAAFFMQLADEGALSDDDIRSYSAEAHAIIAAKLTKAKQRKLGFT